VLRRLPPSRRTPIVSFLIGVLATAGVVWAYLSGGLDGAEQRTLDWRFRSPLTNSVPFSEQLVSIDIDDGALALVGRWPWPRDLQAALVSVPARCGAKALVVDIDWSERETPRLPLPDDADLVGLAPEELASAASATLEPDLELRAAIAAGMPVFPAFANYHDDRLEESPAFEAAVRKALAGDLRGAAAALNGRPKGRGDGRKDELSAVERARLAAAFFEQPGMDERAAAANLNLPVQATADAALACRLAAMRLRLADWQRATPDAAEWPVEEQLAAFYATLTGGGDYFDGSRSLLKEAAALCLRADLSYRRTMRPPMLPDALARAAGAAVDGLRPVYFLIAERAARPGFVNFQPDADGVVRRESLVETHGANQTLQLAVAAACHLLGIEKIERAEPPVDEARGGKARRVRRVLLEPADSAPRRIQLDARRRTVVPWTTAARMHAKPEQYLPAAKLVELVRIERDMAGNEGLRRRLLAELAAMPSLAAHAEIAAIAAGLDKLERDIRHAHLELRRETESLLREQFVEYARRLDRQAARLVADAKRQAASAPVALTADGEGGEAAEADFADVSAILATLERAARANEALRRDHSDLITELTRRLRGKVCVLGYTASALADMKPTPLSGSMPGVRAHLNLLNGLLVNRLVSWAEPWQNALVTGALGVVMTAVAAARRRLALVTLALLAAGLLGAAAWLFRAHTYWLAVVPGLAAIFTAYVLIALYQFSFADREKRALTKALGQYTSATLAKRMAEQPELCRRAETREVSAMFTDLAGFTTISERIGAERTQRVLNVSLGRFTDVMLQHEAMVNKFIGDGIFSFWNPVIYPQADHAERACRTAIELFDALRAMAEEARRSQGDETFAQLSLRVGVATGPAVVGPCGSEQKYDYTCIGDSVNLAARLEGANKVFGTRILVNDRTRELAGRAFAFRGLGRVQVKGKLAGVPIYEVIGYAAGLPADDRAYAERFEAAVKSFQERDFAKARGEFEALAAQRPADLACAVYLSAIEKLLREPPGDAWSGAIELTEK
jgi:class 3 adenylate cyclase